MAHNATVIDGPDTGSTPEPSDWERSTDTIAAVQPVAPSSKPGGGVVVKAFGHRLAIPTATVITAIMGAMAITYEAADRHLEAYKARIDALEAKTAKLESAHALNAQALAQIQTSLARIDARVAEVQVTLMRRR